jgi:arabinose-5-phosphate isomerase
MKIFKETMRILGDAVSSISHNEFNALLKDCLEILRAGGKLVASGLGKNVPICEKFVGTLNSVGVPAAFMHTNTAAHGDLGMVRDEDLVIILTKSGETSESIYLVQELKKRNCKIWLISFSHDSTLSKAVQKNLIISLEHEGDIWNILPNNSTLLNLIVLQELAMKIISEQNIPIDILRQNHPGGAIGVQMA